MLMSVSAAATPAVSAAAGGVAAASSAASASDATMPRARPGMARVSAAAVGPARLWSSVAPHRRQRESGPRHPAASPAAAPPLAPARRSHYVRKGARPMREATMPIEIHRDASAQRADSTIDQNWEAYTPEEHAVWSTLFDRQVRLLKDRVVPTFLDHVDGLAMAGDGIPDFRRLNEILEKATGWTVVAVPGLVPDAAFFEH